MVEKNVGKNIYERNLKTLAQICQCARAQLKPLEEVVNMFKVDQPSRFNFCTNSGLSAIVVSLVIKPFDAS